MKLRARFIFANGVALLVEKNDSSCMKITSRGKKKIVSGHESGCVTADMSRACKNSSEQQDKRSESESSNYNPLGIVLY